MDFISSPVLIASAILIAFVSALIMGAFLSKNHMPVDGKVCFVNYNVVACNDSELNVQKDYPNNRCVGRDGQKRRSSISRERRKHYHCVSERRPT